MKLLFSIQLTWTVTILWYQTDSIVTAQQKPFFNSTQFENINSLHRTNVCDRQAAVDNGTLPIQNALAGLDISAGLFIEEYFNFREDGSLDPDDPGLMAVLMDELARRAGFQWRNTFGITTIPDFTEGRTFTGLLNWTATYYDISVDWWPSTMERLRLGMSFQQPWYDADLIMVKDSTKSDNRRFDFFAFVRPFAPSVWIAIPATILLSTIIYMILERINPNTSEVSGFGKILFQSAISFTDNYAYDPKTNAARLYAFSETFLALLVLSSYTANLASFLVVRNVPRFDINNIDDVVRYGQYICVSPFTDANDVITSRYQGFAKIINLPTEEEMFQAVLRGDCLVAVTTEVSWRLNEGNINSNPSCSLKRIGDTVLRIPASFGFRSDAGSFCTSLVRDVTHLHMTEMEADGFIEAAWENEVRSRQTIVCAAERETQSDESTTPQLTFSDLGGMFMIHAVVGVIVVIGAYVSKWRNAKRQHRPQQQEGVKSVSDSRFSSFLNREDNTELMASSLRMSTSTAEDRIDMLTQDFSMRMDQLKQDFLDKAASLRGSVAVENATNSMSNRRIILKRENSLESDEELMLPTFQISSSTVFAHRKGSFGLGSVTRVPKQADMEDLDVGVGCPRDDKALQTTTHSSDCSDDSQGIS